MLTHDKSLSVVVRIASSLCIFVGLILVAVALVATFPRLSSEDVRDVKVVIMGLGFILVTFGAVVGALGCVSNRSRMFVVISFGLAPLLYLIGIALVYPFQIDDSYISLRYARNLALGYGLVFNPDGQRIEGYTNFLLVLYEAALIRLGFEDLWLVKLFMIVCGLSTLAIMVWYGQRLFSGGPDVQYWLPTVAASLVATSSPLVLWTVSGMETALFVLLVCTGVVSYLLFLRGHFVRATSVLTDLMLVFAALTRPEGLLFWGITTAHTLWLQLVYNRSKLLNSARFIGILGGSGLLTLYGFWKLAYFGQVLPATYFAKQAPLSFYTLLGGGLRLVGFLSINGNFFLVMLIVIGLVSAITIQQRVKTGLWYVAIICGAYLVYVLSLGYRIAMDDAYRFYVPLIPLMGILFIEFTFLVRDHIIRHSSIWMIGCALSLSILTPLRFIDLWHAWRTDLNWGVFSYQIAARDVASGLEQGHIALGKWLRKHASPTATIVLFDAGAIPYFSELRAIDTWSLTDPHLLMLNRALVAAKSETEREDILNKMRDYVLSQDPEYIIQDNLSLLRDPAVQARYQPSGYRFVYLSSYMCGRQQTCSYILEPWQRRDAR